MKLFPFSSKTKELEHRLTEEIKSLQNKLEENELDEELREIETKSIDVSDSSTTLSGMSQFVDEFYDKAMLQRLYASETWFFIAVHTIAKTIAALPIKLEKKKRTTQRVNNNGEAQDVSKVSYVDASGEPEYYLLNKPNATQSAVEFWMLIIIDLMATGDAFILKDKGEAEDSLLFENQTQEARLRRAIDKNKTMRVRGLYRLSSGMVKPVPSQEDNRILDGYGIQTDRGYFTFGQDEVIHIRLPNPVDPFWGLAPIIAAFKHVLLDRYTAEHMIRFYKQGARLGGVIETQKKLTKDQMTRLERVFESNFTGKRNHHKTLILPEGMKYQTIEQNPGETALIEFLKQNKEPVLAVYNMPPIKAGLLDGATYANATVQDKTYYEDCIKPFSKFIESAINADADILPPLKQLKFSYDFSEIKALQEDMVAQSNAAKGMLDSGMSINEVREKVWKLSPVKGGDKIPVLEKLDDQPFIPFGGKNNKPEEIKTDANNSQNDTSALSDITPTESTFEQRVSQLVAEATAQGINLEVAIPKAIAQAMDEGFAPSAKFEGINPSAEKKTENQNLICGYTKEFLIEFQKATTGEGVDHLIEKRFDEVQQFFSRMEKHIIKKVKKKSYQTKESGLEFVSEQDMDSFMKSEIKRISEVDKAAMRHGYKQSLSGRPMTFPNEQAEAALKEVGAKKIKYITETTRKQINKILSDSFSEQVAPGEISSRIRDVFPEMVAGRAKTIARTETLTAVSMGQKLKVDNFRKQFPKESAKMKKVWISAQDERVRDSHEDLDGMAVGIDEEFKSGLKFPRDPDCEDPSEVINCRCSTIEYFPEDEEEINNTLDNGSPIADDADKADENIVDDNEELFDEDNEEKSAKGGPGSGRRGEGGSQGPYAINKETNGENERLNLGEGKGTLDYQQEDGVYYLVMVETNPEYKNQGIATKLVDNFLKEVNDNNGMLDISAYTDEGRQYLKPVFDKLLPKYPNIELTGVAEEEHKPKK